MKTIQELRDFFAGIPEDKWCVNILENGKGQRCALGHLHAKKTGSLFDFLDCLGVPSNALFKANDNANRTAFYGCPDPQAKARVLGYLDGLVKDQES